MAEILNIPTNTNELMLAVINKVQAILSEPNLDYATATNEMRLIRPWIDALVAKAPVDISQAKNATDVYALRVLSIVGDPLRHTTGVYSEEEKRRPYLALENVKRNIQMEQKKSVVPMLGILALVGFGAWYFLRKK
jgi:hypothetical protein